MTRAGEGEGRRFALNCGPTSKRKHKMKRVPFSEGRGGSSVPGCNANATRAMYSQNRLTGRHRNHYSHQNLRCSAYASHCPKTTPNLQPIPPPFDPLAPHQASPSSPESHGAPQDHLLQDADAGAPRRNRGSGRRHRPPFPSSLCSGPIPEFSGAKLRGGGSRSNVHGGGRGAEGPRWV